MRLSPIIAALVLGGSIALASCSSPASVSTSPTTITNAADLPQARSTPTGTPAPAQPSALDSSATSSPASYTTTPTNGPIISYQAFITADRLIACRTSTTFVERGNMISCYVNPDMQRQPLQYLGYSNGDSDLYRTNTDGGVKNGAVFSATGVDAAISGDATQPDSLWALADSTWVRPAGTTVDLGSYQCDIGTKEILCRTEYNDLLMHMDAYSVNTYIGK
ncbi:MAG: hypothetical protein Q3962_09430 [Corynebacterium sp.]|nr:hypothetical protein [Corynebacterium sp.]